MEGLDETLIWPIVGAMAAGAVIGAEREYRASPAGLRTHVLVSLACCLLMVSAVHQMAWLSDTPIDVIRIDPVRMAHGILTGIGFLCGGVIFREGFTVHGLTTAASLWATATLGTLFGIGFYQLAIAGTVATVLVLGAATLTENRSLKRRIAHISVAFEAAAECSIAEFRQILADHGLKVGVTRQDFTEHSFEYTAVASGYTEEAMDALVAALRNDKRIRSFTIKPQTN